MTSLAKTPSAKKVIFVTTGSLLFGLVVSTSSPAHAEPAPDAFGVGVLRCFHPDAELLRMTFTSNRTEASGIEVRKGWLKFKDSRSARSESMMSFAFETKTQDKDLLVRITPLMDNGFSAPETDCYLRDWQRAY